MTTESDQLRRLSRSERGSSLVFTLLILFVLLALTVAGLSGTRSDLQMTSNYRTGLQALLAAEAGILHAKESIEGYGPSRFDTFIVPQWSSFFGTGSKPISGYSSVGYTVSASADSVDPVNFMLLTAAGQAPNESSRGIDARLRRVGAYSPGAIYLPSDGVSPDFNGNKFLVDGNDTNLNGTLNPAPNTDVPGITTSNDTARDEVRNELSSGQEDNVIGMTATPSVETSSGFTPERLRDEILPALLARPGVVTNPNLSGHDTFGSVNAPQITHFTGNVTLNGTVDGAGILIVDQGLTFASGDMTFTGLIIVRGTTELTAVQGNATILGAIWTTDLELKVGGSASVTYSTEALALANLVAGESLPQRVNIVAWKEY